MTLHLVKRLKIAEMMDAILSIGRQNTLSIMIKHTKNQPIRRER